MDFSTKLSELGGKVERSLALLERINERQDRSEERVNRVEGEVDALRDRMEAQREADRAEFTRQITSVQKDQRDTALKVWMGVGIVGALTFLLPLLARFIPTIGG